MFKDYEDAYGVAGRGVIRNNQEDVRAAFRAYPELAQEPDQAIPWVIDAVWQENKEMAELLIECGCDVNATKDNGCTSALSSAIGKGKIDIVQMLLKHGADPNLPGTRTIIGAINADDHNLEIMKILLDHGVDVNQVFDLYGNPDILFTAVDFAAGNTEIVDYLRSKGAKTVDELRAEGKLPPAKVEAAAESDEDASLPEQAVKWFDKNIGSVNSAALTEIVPTDLPITIHVIPSTNERPFVTLFTSGMSEKEMSVPEGQDEFALAELFIQLPKGWKYKDLQNPKWNWPILWLRKIARLPHDHETWLGGPATIIAEDEVGTPIAPGLPFTSMFLLAEHSFKANDGRTVQLYRLAPLYPEERELEINSGLPALMNAFDKHSIPFIVNVNRVNVATP